MPARLTVEIQPMGRGATIDLKGSGDSGQRPGLVS